MKLTIKNFKAIQLLEDFNLESFNVLSGVNSGGKTSFIQFLLLIKQSIEANNDESPLILNKPYTSLGNYKDILHNKNLNNEFGFSLKFDKQELVKNKFITFGFKKVSGKNPNQILVKFIFANKSNRTYIQKFEISFICEENIYWLRLDRERGKKYSLSTNWYGFLNDEYRILLNRQKKSNKGKDQDELNSLLVDPPYTLVGYVEFDSLFPKDIYCTHKTETLEVYYDFSPVITSIKRYMVRIFSQISYLGPLRDEPHSYYLNDNDANIFIGNRGENAAYIFAKNSDKEVNNYKIKKGENGEISYISQKTTLEKSVKYWLCEIFKMAEDININKYRSNTIYEISITNNIGLKSSINHVGFGLSQIFPIIVEGLRIKSGSTLILEQPEIHLHPRIQSLLFDFLYSLTLAGKRIVVETHSDHLITRLRRRVAEDITNKLTNNISLIFFDDSIENRYRVLSLSEMGSLNYWPDGFFDQYESDLKLIVKAQSRKRKFLREAEKNE